MTTLMKNFLNIHESLFYFNNSHIIGPCSVELMSRVVRLNFNVSYISTNFIFVGSAGFPDTHFIFVRCAGLPETVFCHFLSGVSSYYIISSHIIYYGRLKLHFHCLTKVLGKTTHASESAGFPLYFLLVLCLESSMDSFWPQNYQPVASNSQVLPSKHIKECHYRPIIETPSNGVSLVGR